MGRRRFKQNPKTGRMEGAYGGPGETPPTPAPRALVDVAANPPATHATTSAYTAYTSQVEERKREFLTECSTQMGMSPGALQRKFDRWLNEPESFEHRTSPDPRFAHTPASSGLPDTGPMRVALNKLGYEQYLAQPLPVFVYGTLREGQGNSGLMFPAVTGVEPGRVNGVAIYSSRYGFPYACEDDDPESVTVGEKVTLDDGYEGRGARYRLDMLEGFDSDWPSDSHYERRTIDVKTTAADGTVRAEKCWIYVARGESQRRLNSRDRIWHGDWVKERRQNNDSDSYWSRYRFYDD